MILVHSIFQSKSQPSIFSLLQSMEQRLKLQSDSVSEGFTLGLVQSIQELSQGSQSYRITFNVKNSGISYKAGDRLEVLPANTQTIVKRMLLSLCVDASDLSESSMCVKVDKKEWRQESPPLCCFVVCFGVFNMKTRPFDYFI